MQGSGSSDSKKPLPTNPAYEDTEPKCIKCFITVKNSGNKEIILEPQLIKQVMIYVLITFFI